jgi:hypothetical protein
MMRALCIAAAIAATTPASADVLKIFAELHGGGAHGIGTSGEKVVRDAAFFVRAPDITYGALIGAELAFLDAWIQHHQLTDGERIATWSQFGLGVHVQIGLGGARQKAHQGGFFEVGAGAWFGLGTGQQVDPPLDNAQISDRALLLEGRLGVGGHLNSVLDVGVALPVSWGYFLKNGNGAAIDDASSRYQGVQGEVLAFVRANIRLL